MRYCRVTSTVNRLMYDAHMKKSTATKKVTAYRLAKLLGISRQAVSKWGDTLPPARAAQLTELMRDRPELFKKQAKKA